VPVSPKANELALNRKLRTENRELRSMCAYSEEVVNRGNYVFFTALYNTPQDEFVVKMACGGFILEDEGRYVDWLS